MKQIRFICFLIFQFGLNKYESQVRSKIQEFFCIFPMICFDSDNLIDDFDNFQRHQGCMQEENFEKSKPDYFHGNQAQCHFYFKQKIKQESLINRFFFESNLVFFNHKNSHKSFTRDVDNAGLIIFNAVFISCFVLQFSYSKVFYISHQNSQALKCVIKNYTYYPIIIKLKQEMLTFIEKYPIRDASQLKNIKDFDVISKQWDRLSTLFGPAKAVKVCQQVLHAQYAKDFIKFSDQEMKLNFPCDSLQDSSSEIKIPDITERISKASHGEKEMEQEAKMKIKIKIEETINEVKSQSIPKDEKILEKQKRQMKEYLNQYKGLNYLNQKDIEEAFQMTQSYLQTSRVLSETDIVEKIEKKTNTGLPKSKTSLLQYLQIIDSALYHSSNCHRLRFTQILAMILFLNKSKNQKILLQILTGQGKSTIISCLAAILTISGLKVDIVTTSQILARRDVEQKKKFYQILGLNVCHNFEENQKGPKDCYASKNIVCGTPHSFQVDILFDQYKQKETRMKRPFQVLIIDEVDSMFVDQKGHQTLLATTYPGFSELIYPMKIIWNKIRTYPIFEQNDKLMMAIPDGDNNIITGEVRKVMDQVIKDLRKQFKNEIIPKWRMKFIDLALDDWILSAIKAAYKLKQKEDYLIKNGNIVPVDYKNTGTIQDNVHWQHGLHQFLQMKHNLMVSTQGMTSNFISNQGHFDKYKYLFGLTGTLGSKQSKNFLQQTYQVQMMKIVPFKTRLNKNYDGMVLYDEVEWVQYIVGQVKKMLDCKRSILLICQSIREVNLIQKAVKNIDFCDAQYITTGEQQFKDTIDTCQFIAATNLAGRGTDIKISKELNENGGLHVIIGFMPHNLRVEMQGRGRAGRNGCQGSSELAVNYVRFCDSYLRKTEKRSDYEQLGYKDIAKLTKIRDHLQAKLAQNDLKTVESLRAKDKMFKIYCQGVTSIKDFRKNIAMQLALEQEFAMFLKMVDKSDKCAKYFLKDTKQLVERMIKDPQAFYNPNHEIHRGISEILEDCNEEAIKHFENAVVNTSITAKIIAYTLKNACQINQDKKDKESVLKGFSKVKSLINDQKQIIRAMKVLNNTNQQSQKYEDYQKRKENKYQQELKRKYQLQTEAFKKDQISQHLDEESQASSMSLIRESQEIANNQIELGIDQQSQATHISLQDAQERVLNALQDRIQDIQDKIKNAKEGQTVTIAFQRNQILLNAMEGDRRENEAALSIFEGEGLKLLPVAKIVKKKKAPWWKRTFAFALGVFQTILGACLVAATAGVLTKFGVTMMTKGVKQCYDAIFSPQQLNKLLEYYGEVALCYASALFMSGIQGVKELAKLTGNGFTLIKETPWKDFFSTLVEKTKEGVKMMPSNFLPMTEDDVSSSSQQKNKDKMIDKLILESPIRKLIKNPGELKKIISQIHQEEEKEDEQMIKIKQRFDYEMIGIIRSCREELNGNQIEDIQNMNLSQEQIYHLISQGIRQGLKLPKSQSNQAKELVEIFENNINNKDLAKVFVEKIKLNSLIQQTISKIKKSNRYKIKIKEDTIKRIYKAFEKEKKGIQTEIRAKKQALKCQKDEIEIKKKQNLLPSRQMKQLIVLYNSQFQKFSPDNQQFKKFQKQYKQKYNEPRQLYNILKENDALNGSKIDMQRLQKINLHQYTKQALRKLQYVDYVQSRLIFEQNLENAIYNQVVNFGQRIIDNIHIEQAKLGEKLRSIKKIISK